jgi:hypothetical protein
MNWARPEYDRVGSAAVALCNALAGRGYPVDLTPSSQAGSALWRRGADGYVYYGEQRYAQIVFFGESDSDRSDFEWLENLSGKDGKTQLVRMAATAGGEQLTAAAERISGQLHASRIAPQTAWQPFSQWDLAGARPPLRGKARYIDGTQVWTAAEKYPGGDELTLHSEPVGEDVHAPVISVSATGLFACRFSEQGELVALAAGALKRFEGGGLSLDLGEQPTDLAMWIGLDGKWHGVIQAAENRLPEGLAKLNGIQWKFLAKEEVHSLD